MNIVQLIGVIISGLILFGTIIGLYVYIRIELAKLQVQLDNFRRELDAEKIAHLQTEKFNREDHKEILSKLDLLIKDIFIS